uniref:Kinesin motor domain-containing protein n=1 Tax=Panagrellus redivivus TaxID=6233 RepID=A0A7E4ZQY5_PANRE
MLAPDPERSLRLRIRSRCLPFGGSAPGSGSGSYDTEPPAPEPGHGSGAAPKKFKKIFERVNCPKNSRRLPISLMGAGGDNNADGTCPVIVAARVRPFNEMEKANYHESTLTVLPRDSSILVQNRPGAFEFDYVYGMDSNQEDVYNSAIKDLVENTFDGYNATVCAYGQTGSGKTFTMGTAVNYSSADVDNTRGIVPRAAEHFFAGIEERKRQALEKNMLEPDFDISVQFIEIYNENFIDLFCSRDSRKKVTVYYDKTVSSILVKGVNIRKIKNPAEMLEALKDGSVNRSVAATKMNSDSSRSHAIFTVYIRQKRQIPPESPDAPTDFEILNAKFHFVDLAGSERMDKTGATGTHALEGININSGLLQLGNVVNALVSGSKFVPYRNSKLTLMLQDSLGGNSRTAVIVCVSPSDFNFAETLQTLNFGLRLRNITTKVTANQDPQSAIINELKNKVKQLQTENEQLKNGKRTVNADGEIVQSDLYRENLELMDQINQHKTRIKALESVVESANARNISLQRQALVGHVQEGEDMKEATEGDTVSALAVQMLEDNEKLHSQLHEYQATIDDLNKQVNHYRRIMIDMERDQDMSVTYNQRNGSLGSPDEPPENDFLEQAMQNVELMKAEAARIRNMHAKKKHSSDDDEGDFDDEDETEPMDTGEDGDGEIDVEMAESDAAEDEEDNEQENEFEENKKVAYEISQDLANLNQDIVFKEKLISEIRNQRAEMDKIRANYEMKLKGLQEKIEQTAAERDRQLADLQKQQSRPGGNTAENKKQIEKVTKEYESKMAKLITEQNKFKKMEKSHEKLKQTVAQKDKIIESREKEMRDLKANKVDLVKQLKAVQASRVQFERAAAKRERLQALENQKYKNKIQLLERKGDMREKMLARTRDEMKRKSRDFELKQKLKALTAAPVNRTPKKSAVFSPDRVHKIFKTLTAGVVSTARRRQLYDVYNEELTSLIEERRVMVQKKAKLEAEFLATKTSDNIETLQAEIDSLNEKCAYVDTRQVYLQKLIVGEADEHCTDAFYAHYG